MSLEKNMFEISNFVPGWIGWMAMEWSGVEWSIHVAPCSWSIQVTAFVLKGI